MRDFRRRNQMYYYPTCQMSIDETLFLFKGRVRFQQRMPMKPQGTGLKYFIIADSNGFIWNTFLYKGRETTELNFEESSQKADRKESQTVNIVHYFLQTLSKTGHVLFMDKYYGGLNVMEEVLNAKQHGVVACQNNRPTDLFSECLAAGKCFYC